MQVEAIYNHGKLEFIAPLQLTQENFRLQVILPDDAIITQPAYNLPQHVIERAKATLARMETIKNTPLPADQEQPELTAKQMERIEAFALRDEIKGLR
jgi:hypothetical protein